MPGAESHYVNRTGWLRAAVLGANDGIISTASLVVGVAAAGGARGEILTAAVAGWAAGAMSMAAANMSRSARRPTPKPPISSASSARSCERPAEEKEELAHIYEDRGLKPKLAQQVAGQLMAKDALRTPMRATSLASPTPPSPDRSRPLSPQLYRFFARRRSCQPRAAFLAAQEAVGWVVTAASIAFLVGLGALGAGASRRLVDAEAGNSGRLLGRAGDGGDGRDRRADRQGGLRVCSRAR